jgi:hypothetical protein
MKKSKLSGNNIRLVLTTLALTFILSAIYLNLGAQSINFEVLSTEVVTEVTGVNGYAQTWENAENAKGIIVKVKATFPKEVILWACDFNIAYKHSDGSDDRTKCKGITTVVSSPEDEGAWLIGEYIDVTASSGTKYFRLLFGVENDINTIALNYARTVAENIHINRD